MASERALTGMKRRRLMDLSRAVPEMLLDIGTSEVVFARIEDARDLLGEDRWGCHDSDADHPESSSSSAGGDGHDVGGVPLNTTCGISAGIRYDDMAPDPDFSADLWNEYAVPVPDFSADLWNDSAPTRAPDSSSDIQYDEGASGQVDWKDLLAFALAPKGPFCELYGEITRLVSLHREAAHVFFVCTRNLGIQSGGGHNLGGQPDDDAARTGLQPDGDTAWERRGELRASVVRHAHDALLRLRSAASAVTAAEEFIRFRPLDSTGRKLLGDARRSLDEVKDSVRLMRDAAVREYFETWMILLNRA
jgi:hypothetical protein